MRTLGSFVLWLVAMVAVAITLPLAWVGATIADEDGYVSFTAPFATDEELQDALVEGVTDQVLEVSGVSVGQELVRRIVDQAFGRLVEDPDFPQAWRESQRSSHRATFGDAQEERIVIDLAPFVALVGDDLLAQIPGAPEAPGELLVPVTRETQPEAIEAVREAPARAIAGAGVAVLATVGSLLVARRRGTALGWWGLGVASVGAGYMVFTGDGVLALLRSDPAAGELADTMQELLLTRAVASFEDWSLVAVVVGGVAAVLGFGARVLRR